jgi:hypothetical protein
VDTVARLLVAFQHTMVYWVLLFFFGFYPVFSAIIWLTTSLVYYLRKERMPEERKPASMHSPTRLPGFRS